MTAIAVEPTALESALAWHAAGATPESAHHVDAILADRARLIAELEQLRAPKLKGLTLPEAPSSNRWWRQTVIPAAKGRPARAMQYLSEEAREYKANIAQIVRTKPHEGDVRVWIDWYRGIRSGDLDKRQGVILDALQGRFYLDDKQIVELHARRFDDPGRARIVVRVEPVGVVQTSFLAEP